MAKYELNNQILKTVENQIIDNDPAIARETFVQLREMNYTEMQALELIGSAFVTELNDMTKEHRKFSESGYTFLLQHVVKEAGAKEVEQVEFDEIQKSKNAGYDALMKDDKDEMVSCFLRGFEELKAFVKKEFQEQVPTLQEVDEKTNFKYGLGTWLQDIENELNNVDMQKERIQFCEDMMELFAWNKEGKDGFLATIGEAYAALGNVDVCKKWFNDWLAREPFNAVAVGSFLQCLVKLDETECAEEIVMNHISDDLECDLDTEPLFGQAQAIMEKAGNTEKAEQFADKIAVFHKKCLNFAKAYEREVRGAKNEDGSKKKIYPNDPCPCGSGKKYKQCCGRK